MNTTSRKTSSPVAAQYKTSRTKPSTKHVVRSPKQKGFAFERTEGEETWLTPRWLVDALRLSDIADVDPCAPMRRHWKTAKCHFNEAQDGFNRVWCTNDFFWVNPPYGRQCSSWMEKLAEHGNGLLLIFARTDTVGFHSSVLSHPNTTALFFFKGRLKFANRYGEEVGTAGAPSVLVAYGKKGLGVLRSAIERGELEGQLLVYSR